MSKRNRVYSLERNKLLRLAFARRYVNYLEPVLKKIKDEKSSSNRNQNGEVNVSKLVRFEMDMAMVMSASKEFAWSRSLKAQLQLQLQHYYPTGIVEEKVSNDESSLASTLSPCSNASLTPVMDNNILENSKMMMSKQSSSRRLKQVSEGTSSKEERNYENEEEESVKSRLTHLRKLLPGGNEIGDIELLTELASYITCLELQVNILDCLCGNGN
ncbi:hypothetical protein FNV43_RR03200 [Rhamnella rubrinervis]|uniref:IBH1-like N-terminal domain-containing protein n=1 Tax=Rhamnella rubrinervis TaxID=2594499 RepID=A0A8K0MNN3_9ROSA|nr:hypothetical protein FNV43_RR03200 [Rhamnella rubrinervis]